MTPRPPPPHKQQNKNKVASTRGSAGGCCGSSWHGASIVHDKRLRLSDQASGTHSVDSKHAAAGPACTAIASISCAPRFNCVYRKQRLLSLQWPRSQAGKKKRSADVTARGHSWPSTTDMQVTRSKCRNMRHRCFIIYIRSQSQYKHHCI